MSALRITLVAALFLLGCERDSAPPAPPPATGPYADPARWLCGPDANPDHCTSADLSSTRILDDGSTSVVEHTAAPAPAIDCFYVYPTVRFEPECGNAVDFEDIDAEIFAAQNQAARFSSVCRVFAPLYRQRVRCPAFDRDGVVGFREIDDVAFEDVRDAFEHFLRQHGDARPFVLLGHSQGADLLARLVKERVAPDAPLRRRMLVAILPGGDIFVPREGASDETLGDVPLCRSNEETGCVITYRTFSATHPPAIDSDQDPPRKELACTNPAAPEGGRAELRASYLPNPARWKHPLFDLRATVTDNLPIASTPYLLREGGWTAECRRDAIGNNYLSIDSESRVDWIDYDSAFFNPAKYGLHPLDFQFTQGDLIDGIEARAQSMDRDGPSG